MRYFSRKLSHEKVRYNHSLQLLKANCLFFPGQVWKRFINRKKKKNEISPFFQSRSGIWAKKVHACSLRFSALKPCSGAHYSQGQIREYAPLPGNTYRTKNSPCNTYIIWPLERKKQTNISWKIKITKYKFQSKRKQGKNKNQNK